MQAALPLLSGAAMAWATLAPGAAAQDLKLGDPAPPLAITEWVKGEPVALEKGKIYLVEFWATW